MSRWYAAGLRFECTQCGGCCTGPQGYVWLSPRDQESIAHFLGLDLDVFRGRYTRRVGRLSSLVDRSNHDCVFLAESKRCAIHPVKPRQCLTFPFWPRIVASPSSWEEMAETCPGMGQGPLYAAAEVDAIQDRETPKERLWKLTEKPRA